MSHSQVNLPNNILLCLNYHAVALLWTEYLVVSVQT